MTCCSEGSAAHGEECENLWGEVEQHIREHDFLDVLESYPPPHILETLSCFASTHTRNDTLRLLRLGVLARAEVHEIERKMDKSFFEDMVTDSSYAISGTDASMGSPILWLDVGVVTQRCWMLLPGTGKYYAFVRAVLWMMDLATFAASSHEKVGTAVVMSHINSSPLDFKLAAFRLILCLHRRQFPLMWVPKYSSNFRHVGIGKAVSVLVGVMKEALNVEPRCTFELLDFDDLEEVVRDPADIPDFILEDNGKPHFMADWNARLHYSRCMLDDNKVTLRELLEYETAAAALTVAVPDELPKGQGMVKTSRLAVLDEDDEEEQ